MDEILATIRRIIAEDERSSSTGPRGAAGGVPPVSVSPVGVLPGDISNRGTAGGPREAGQAPAEAAGATDVLDLTDVLDEDDSGRRPTPLGTAPGTQEPEAAPAPLSAETHSAEPIQVEATPAEASLRTDRPVAAEARPDPEADRAVAPGPSPVAAQPPGPPPVAAQPSAANDERLLSDVAALAAATAFGRLASAPRTRREPPLVGGRPLDDIVREMLRPLLQTWLDENLPGIVERLVQAEIARISARSGPG